MTGSKNQILLSQFNSKLLFSGKNGGWPVTVEANSRTGRQKAEEHGSTGEMSPQLIFLEQKTGVASCLVNNLKSCSGKKPSAAPVGSL